MIGFQFLPRFIAILGISNHLDEVIKMPQSQEIGFQILRSLLCFPKEVASPANNYFAAVLNKGIQGIEQPQLLGTTLVNRQHVDSKRSFHGGKLKEQVHHHLWASVTLQGNFDAGIIR